MNRTYREAGVDIEKGDRFAEFIRRIDSPAVASSIGGFAGGFELDTTRYEHPVIMTTTDGVGTKLMIAQKLNVFDTVGIDLVAMCVNDLIASGAEPVSFLDYIACGRLEERVLQEIVRGIVRGCEDAGCILSGGETAEMPDMYGPDDFDLAGFAVGVAEKREVLPKTDTITVGAAIYGLPSAGIHSNGFSLARKILPMDDERILKELLVPTKIYVKPLRRLLESGEVRGAAHITGGGLEANIQRVLPDGFSPDLSYDWDVPWIFDEIQRGGAVTTDEMRRVFNLGIGMAVVVDDGKSLERIADSSGIALYRIGTVVREMK